MGWKWDKRDDHIRDFFDGMKPHVKRFLSFDLGDISHAFTNLFVEASRLSAYHAGHIWMIQTVLTTAALIWLAVK